MSPVSHARRPSTAPRTSRAKEENPRPAEASPETGLHYVTDLHPGLSRVGVNGHTRFLNATGAVVRDPATVKRIRALAIPPAWEKVWICPTPDGHLQATGRDARGRKQYLYHPRWREARDETKFNRMIAFGRVLPRLRRRVARDLRAPGLGREKILATIVKFLDLCAIRVGNEEYTSQNNSYGLTTLRNRHARVSGDTIHLHFRGKGGKERELSLHHPALARIVKKTQDLPGQELFQWVDADGQRHPLRSNDVNEYLSEITRAEFTSKDFRTWTATVIAASVLADHAAMTSPTKARACISRAIQQAAHHLGNTVAICRKSYVHPAVIETFLDRQLARSSDPTAATPARKSTPSPCGLRADEAELLRLLREQKARARFKSRSNSTRPKKQNHETRTPAKAATTHQPGAQAT